MRIFQSEKQVIVSIRLNAFGELFSAGEPFNSQSLGVTLMVSLESILKRRRNTIACQKPIYGIHIAPAPRMIAESITIATAATAVLISQMAMVIVIASALDSLYIVLSFRESLLKAKGRLPP